MIYVIPLLLVGWAFLSIPSRGDVRPASKEISSGSYTKGNGLLGDRGIRVRETGDMVYVTIAFDRIFQHLSAVPTTEGRALIEQTSAVVAKKAGRLVILEAEGEPVPPREKDLNQRRCAAAFSFIVSKSVKNMRGNP